MGLPQTGLGLGDSFCWPFSPKKKSLCHKEAPGIGTDPRSGPLPQLFPAALSPAGRQEHSECRDRGLGCTQSRPTRVMSRAAGALILFWTGAGGCCCHLSRQFRWWKQQEPRRGSQEETVSPGAVSLVGNAGMCESRRVKGAGEELRT